MDSHESRPSGPVGDVLFSPESIASVPLLEKILDYCSHSDRKPLLNSRLVCSFWRDCAFSVFANNLSICPEIDLSADDPHHDWTDSDPPLFRFREMVKRSSKLPLKAQMKYFAGNMCPTKMFKDYAHNIVRVEAYDLVFEHELEYTQFPQLQKLMLHFSVEHEVPIRRLREYFRTGGHRLVELVLYNLYDIQIGVFNSLKVLKFGPRASIGGAESLPTLLPNLVRVRFGHENYPLENTKAFTRMADGGVVFTSVVNLGLHERWGLSTEESESMTIKLSRCFPNLRKFEWTRIPKLGRLTAAIQILFSRLENLTSFRLVFESATPSEIFRLLTNLTVAEIPDDKELWSDGIVEPRRTLCNLKNLRSLSLELSQRGSSWKATRMPEVISQFLLQAVFLRLESLQKILFGYIRYNADCVRVWQVSGREFQTIGVKTEEEELAIQNRIDEELRNSLTDSD